MKPIVIIDQPLIADALAGLLQQHCAAPVSCVAPDRIDDLPLNALVFLELFLPDQQCGIFCANRLQTIRPDLTPIVWTTEPWAFHVWAASAYQLPGFLDKAMPTTHWFDCLERAQCRHAWWSHDLLRLAQSWEPRAQCLRALTPKLWHLWLELVQANSMRNLAEVTGCSERTLERRLTDLYSMLGVANRATAVVAASTWQLVALQGTTPQWTPLVQTLFPALWDSVQSPEPRSLIRLM